MLISEIFTGIQGEGFFIGAPAIFIRLFGCSKDCSFCDTPQGREQGHPLSELSMSEVVVKAYDLRKQTGLSLVVITGGEPGEQSAELNDLARELGHREFSVHLETNGEWKGINYSLFNHVTISPKSNNLAWDKIHLSQGLAFKFLHDPKDVTGSVALFDGVMQTANNRLGYRVMSSMQIVDRNYTIEEQLKALRDVVEKGYYKEARMLPQLHKLLGVK